MGVARQECQNAALCFLIVSAFFAFWDLEGSWGWQWPDKSVRIYFLYVL